MTLNRHKLADGGDKTKAIAVTVPASSGYPHPTSQWTPQTADPIQMSGCSSCFPQAVRTRRGQASVLDWATNSEMVEALPIARRDAEHLVNRIIEVAADSGRPNTRLFRLEVKHLAHESGLPEEISVEAGSIDNQTVHAFGDHPKAEGPVPRLVLTAGDPRGQSTAVPSFSRNSGRPCGHDGGRCHRNSGRIACRSVSTFSGSRASTYPVTAPPPLRTKLYKLPDLPDNEKPIRVHAAPPFRACMQHPPPPKGRTSFHHLHFPERIAPSGLQLHPLQTTGKIGR